MDSTNKKDMSAICFSQITTYGELLQALPATGPGNVPSLGFLHQNAKVVLHAKTENGMIEVYDNGYYTYLENDRITVNAVDRCGELKWYTNTGETLVSKDIDLVGLPWTVPLEIAGVNKLAINALMREQSKTIYSLDAPASQDNPHFSIQSEYEARTEENAIAESQENRIILARNILKELSEREREIIQMLYVEGMTQADAAEKLGIDRSSVRAYERRARTKIAKLLGESGLDVSLVPKNRSAVSPLDTVRDAIKTKGERFTRAQIAEIVSPMSDRSLKRYLSMLCESGEIERHGGGRSTWYSRKTI